MDGQSRWSSRFRAGIWLLLGCCLTGQALGAPDLRIDGLQVPATVSPSELVSARVTLTNTGDEDLNLSSIRVFTADGSIDRYGGNGVNVPLGQTAAIPIELYVPKSPAGPSTLTLNVRVEAIGSSSQIAVSRTAEGAARPALGAAVVDLLVTDVRPLTGTLSLERLLPVSVSVRYDAPSTRFVDSGEWLEVGLSANSGSYTGPALGYFWVVLGPRSSTTLVRSLPLPEAVTPGSYAVTTWLQSNRAETDSTNNNRTSSQNVVFSSSQGQPLLNLLLLAAGTLTTTASAGGSLPVTLASRLESPLTTYVLPSYDVGCWLGAGPQRAPATDISLGDPFFTDHVAGDVRTYSQALSVPYSVKPGSYFLHVEADPRHAIRETDESDNTASYGPLSITTGPPVDLRLVSVSWPPSTLGLGASVRLTSVVAFDAPQNAGLSVVGTWVRYTLFRTSPANNTYFLGESWLSLTPGQTTTVSSSFFLPYWAQPGSYSLIAQVDPYANLDESDESNNTRSVPVTTFTSIDLAVTNVAPLVSTLSAEKLLPVSVSIRYDAPAADYSSVSVLLALQAYRLTAEGALTGEVQELFESDVVLSPRTALTLSPFAAVPQAVASGRYLLRAFIDTYGQVSETDETNNSAVSNNVVSLAAAADSPTIDLRAVGLDVTPATTVVAALLTMNLAVAADSQTTATTLAYDLAYWLSTDQTLDRSGDVSLGAWGRYRQRTGTVLTHSGGLYLPLSVAPRSYHVLAEVDSSGRYLESNETNNVTTAGPVTLGPSDIDLELVDFRPLVTTVSLAGELPVSVTLRYTAPSPNRASLNVRTRVYASRDGQLGQGATLLGESYYWLGAQQTASTTRACRWLALTPGDYTLVAVIEPGGGGSETNLNNNSRSVAGVSFSRPSDDHPDTADATSSPRDLLAADGRTVEGTLGHFGDVDYYLLVLPARTNLALSVEDSTASTQPASVRVTLLDADATTSLGQLVSYSGSPAAGTSLRILASASYFVKVEANGAGFVGSYRLRAVADRPDLRLGNLTVPSVLSLSDLIPMTFVATLDARPGFPDFQTSVGYYVSTDQKLDPGFDLGLGTLYFSVSSARPTSVTVRSPQSATSLTRRLPPGRYYLLLDIDAEGLVFESNETNNVLASAPIDFQTADADLRFGSLSLSTSSAAPHQVVTVSGQVELVGGRPGVARYLWVRTALGRNPTPDPSADWSCGDTTLSLPGPGSATFSVQFTVPDGLTTGQRYVTVQLDPDNHHAESNETNNVGAASLMLTGPTVDLSVPAVRPATMRVGLDDTLEAAYEVRYAAPAGTFEDLQVASAAYFFDSPAQPVDRAVPLPGSEVTGTVRAPSTDTRRLLLRLPQALAPGSRTLGVVVDPQKSIPEKDETNNSGFTTAPLSLLPAVLDFRAVAVQVEAASVSAGCTVAVTVTAAIEAPGAPQQAARAELWLSSRPSLVTSQDTLVSSTQMLVSTGGTTAVALALPVPPYWTTGSYRLFARVVSDFGLPDPNLANNVTQAASPLVIGGSAGDLVATDVRALRNAASAGDTLPVSFSVQYLPGGGSCPGYTARAALWLSRDTRLQSLTDRLLGTATVPVQAGAAVAANSSFTVPTDVSAGDYFVLVQLDPFGEYAQAIRTNDVASSPSVLRIRPPVWDLSVVDVQSPASTLGAGRQFPLSVTVRHDAPSIASPARTGWVRVYLLASRTFDAGAPQIFLTTVWLQPGTQQTVQQDANVTTRVPSGRYYLAASVGSDGSGADSDSANDVRIAEQPILVEATGVDLVVTSVSEPPASIVPGGTLHLDVGVRLEAPPSKKAGDGRPVLKLVSPDDVRASHVGSGPLAIWTSLVGFLSKDRAYDRWSSVWLQSTLYSYPTLEAGETRTVGLDLRVPYALEAGSYFVGAALDRYGEVSETDESNNVRLAASATTATSASSGTVTASIDSLSLSTPVVTAGDTLVAQLSAGYRVSSTASAPVWLRLDFYLSDDEQFQPGTDRLLSSGTWSLTRPEVRQSFSHSLTVPRDLRPGSYVLIARGGLREPYYYDRGEFGGSALAHARFGVVAAARNRPPAAVAGRDRTVAVGRSVTLDGSSSYDPDGDRLLYSWQRVSGPSLDLGLATSSSVRFLIPTSGSYTVQLSATDSFGTTGSATVRLTARPESELAPVIDVVAGAVSPTVSTGEGSPALATVVDSVDVAVDPTGNVYFVESSRCRVRKIDAVTHRVTTLVNRSGTAGSILVPGDPGSTKLAYPQGLAIDASGDLYLADTSNHRILRVSGAGTAIATFAGVGPVSPFGTGGFRGDGARAIDAWLDSPGDLAFDAAGTLYFIDRGNQRVRAVDRSGTIRTVAGTGQRGSAGDGGRAVDASFSDPGRLALDRRGNLFVVEDFGQRVRQIDLEADLVSTLVIRPAEATVSGDYFYWSHPGIAVDGANNLFFADGAYGVLRQLDGATGQSRVLAGTGRRGSFGDAGPASGCELGFVSGLTVDAQGTILLGDSFSSAKIRSITPGTPMAPAGVPLALSPRSPDNVSVDATKDADPATPGIQTTVVYDSLWNNQESLPTGLELELEVVPIAGGGSAVVRGSVVDSVVTFTNVSLPDGGGARLVLRRVDLGTVLQETLLLASADPVARASVRGVDLGGPQVVTLDGSASSDPKSRPLSYRWLLTAAPPGAESLASSEAVTTYRASRPGSYTFQLSVSNTVPRTSSAGRTLRIVNVPPVADPGPDQDVRLSRSVPVTLTLDGRASGDVNGEPLTYEWTLAGAPRGSSASVLAPGQTASLASLRFTTATSSDGSGRLLDAGLYQVRLTVRDTGGLEASRLLAVNATDPDNLAPRADAGPNRAVAVTVLESLPVRRLAADLSDPLEPSNPKAFVRLDGRRSLDPQGKPLTYRWTVARDPEGRRMVPSGSQLVQVTDPGLAGASFVPDVPGLYVFELVVSNGVLESPPARCSVLVSERGLNYPPTAVTWVLDVAGGRRAGPGAARLAFVAGRDTVTLDGSRSTDVDDPGRLTYVWTQTRGESVALYPSSFSATASFAPVRPGLYEFQLVCTDPKGAGSAPAAAQLLALREEGAVPVLSLSARQGAASGVDSPEEATDEPVQSLIARTDRGRVDLYALLMPVTATTRRRAFYFKQLSGPAVALTTSVINTTEWASSVSFSPTTAGVEVFRGTLVELDDAGASTGLEVSRLLRVIVETPSRRAPVARISDVNGKVTAAACSVVRLDASGSAAGGTTSGTTLRYRWEVVSGPHVQLSDPFSVATTFVSVDGGDDQPRELVLQLTVDDGAAVSAPAFRTVVMDPTVSRTVTLTGLRRGLNLIGCPVELRAGGASRAADLVSAVGALGVVAGTPASRGRTQFRFHGGHDASPGFSLEGNAAYFALRPTGSGPAAMSGPSWSASSLVKPLQRGLNLIAYPRGFPPNETVETLRARVDAAFVVRHNPATGKFEVYLPGVTRPFPIETGSGYILSAPSSVDLQFPVCGQ